jgi:serine/threonine-protein kinase
MGTHTLAPGTILGRYELLLPIAQGGMATVWAARQRGSRGFSKTVAIKTILPNLSDDPQFEQMFLDEATIASKIHHPNVAEILDLGEQDEVLYLVMEWVDGESLSTLSKQSRKNGTDIPLRVGLKVLSQACAGLHAAHELCDDDDRPIHLVHRDVSPQNILVSSAGVVKIVDFGVAKALGRSGETSAGQLKGKVPFMSPEQAKGGAVDRRTDVFALGILLYRIGTGAHPFLDDSDIKTMRNIITRPPMPPRVKNPKLGQSLERIILKALQKDPERRYQTAAELGAEIDAAMAHEGGAVTVEEVATFVRSTMGERDRKRRAAIRDAALKMDEGLTSNPRISAPPDSVSGVMLTKTATPPTAITNPEVTVAAPVRASQPSIPDPPAPGEPAFASSPTLAALAATRPGTSPSRRTKAIAIAIAAVCGVGAGAFAVTRVGGDPAPAAGPQSSAAAPGEPPRSEATALPDDGAAAASASAVADESGTQLSIDDMPDAPGKTAGRRHRGRWQPRGAATGAPSGKATATAGANAGGPPPPAGDTPKGNGNVPAVQEPGF